MKKKLFDVVAITLSAGLTSFAIVKAKSYQQNIESIEEKEIQVQDDKPNLHQCIGVCASKLSQWKLVNNVPGIVVGVSKSGKTVWTYSDGLADVENNVKCHQDTVMRIASISKPITTALLGHLLQQRKVSLDEPISKYLKQEQFPVKLWDGKKVEITLRQLASHCGGIRHYKKNDSKQSDSEYEFPEMLIKDHFSSVFDSLKIFKDDPLVAKPGTKYNYSTFGYTLLSAVIEAVVNEPFDKQLMNFVNKTLGMNNTFLDIHSTIIPNRCSFYMKMKPNGKLINVPYVDNSYKWAGGGLLSTVPDLIKFGNAMLYCFKGGFNGKKGFLNKEIIDQLWKPVPSEGSRYSDWGGYAIGWQVFKDAQSQYAFCAEPPFENIAMHSGGAVGASSALVIQPQQEIVVVILANLQEAQNITQMAIEIAKKFSSIENQ